MTTYEETTKTVPTRSALDIQLERTCWALFLIMIGALALLPDGMVPAGTWLAGTGIIMIGMNVARHAKNLRVSGFTAILGVVALGLGISAITGVDLPVLAILIVAVGLHIVYTAITNK